MVGSEDPEPPLAVDESVASVVGSESEETAGVPATALVGTPNVFAVVQPVARPRTARRINRLRALMTRLTVWRILPLLISLNRNLRYTFHW